MKLNNKIFNKKYFTRWILKTVIAYLFAFFIFKFERWFYINRKDKKIKRRLFLTSGNINLINALTIIKQLNEKNTEDILVIDSVCGSQMFIERNLEVANKHNFKKIITLISGNILFSLMLNNIYKVDEIYAHTNIVYSKLVQPFYKEAKYIIIDEGLGSLIEVPNKNNKYITSLITAKYLNKLDRLGWNNQYQQLLDIHIFRNIVNEISNKYPFDIDINNEDKVIIFCSAYYFKQLNLSKEYFYNFQNSIIEQLLSKGYKVIYKYHPRESDNISLPDGVMKSNCLLPLELYNLNVIGILSVASSVSIQPYHYWKIPGFHALNETLLSKLDNSKLSSFDIGKFIIKDYSLNYEELLKVNPQEYSYIELRNYFEKLFQMNIDKKGLLSENKKLNQIYNRYTHIVSK